MGPDLVTVVLTEDEFWVAVFARTGFDGGLRDD